MKFEKLREFRGVSRETTTELREDSRELRRLQKRAKKQFSKMKNHENLPSVQNPFREGKVIINENFSGIKHFFGNLCEGEFMLFQHRISCWGLSDEKTANFRTEKAVKIFSIMNQSEQLHVQRVSRLD
jgi:hypothetical protein